MDYIPDFNYIRGRFSRISPNFSLHSLHWLSCCVVFSFIPDFIVTLRNAGIFYSRQREQLTFSYGILCSPVTF